MENTSNSSLRVLTIGHSNHQVAHFLDLLKSHSVQVVADTRSYPYSEYATQFDQKPLKMALEADGVGYVFLGRELGGRPDGDEFYDEQGHVLYGRVAETELFQEGVSRLEKGIREYKVAMLCAEENPAACHRRLLIGRVLSNRGIQVDHIRGDGRIQTEAELVAETNPAKDQLALFEKVEAEPWKSIPSVLRKKRQNSSSAFLELPNGWPSLD
jgi:uncharacterized protein (DUF488 family)